MTCSVFQNLKMFFQIFLFCYILCYGYVQSDSRIVNGTSANEGEFPFAVSLRYNSSHTCGGTILNERYILTAAHCVCQQDKPRDHTLYSIQYDMVEITNEPVNIVNVDEIFCHNYDQDKLIYDCAVLKLETPIPPGKWEPVKISNNFISEKEKTATIIGWGRLYHMGPLARHLQKLEVDLYDDETCAKNTEIELEHHICFGAMFGGACNGDSGTALLVHGVQVGIASYITSLCGVANKENPNVYSRVSTYYDWIKEKAEM